MRLFLSNNRFLARALKLPIKTLVLALIGVGSAAIMLMAYMPLLGTISLFTDSDSVGGNTFTTAANFGSTSPTGLVATGGETQVALDWNDNTEPDLAGYNVYRSTTSGGPYTMINGPLVATSDYTDTGVTSGTTYYYVVTAQDTGGQESGYSNEDSASPLLTLSAVADTYVKEEKGGDDNFGTAVEMVVKPDPTKVKRALVAFDLSSIPAGSTVNSATLTVCLTTVVSGRVHELRMVTSSWVETAVVWNNQPTASATVTDSITVPAAAGCESFTVTSDVQAWVNGTANNGWQIRDQDETTSVGDSKYRTRENGTVSERPNLQVDYTSP